MKNWIEREGKKDTVFIIIIIAQISLYFIILITTTIIINVVWLERLW